MLIRVLATLFLIVALAITIAKQSPKRANAWGGVFAGVLMLVGSLVAMPWLPASGAGEVGAVLRGLFSPTSWLRTLARDLRWLLALAVVLLLWRWIGGNYYR